MKLVAHDLGEFKHFPRRCVWRDHPSTIRMCRLLLVRLANLISSQSLCDCSMHSWRRQLCSRSHLLVWLDAISSRLAIAQVRVRSHTHRVAAALAVRSRRSVHSSLAFTYFRFRLPTFSVWLHLLVSFSIIAPRSNGGSHHQRPLPPRS